MKERLGTVSNKKLLHLADVTKQVKDKYGTRDKLVETLTRSQGKAKDNDYAARLGALSTARLLDLARASERRARRA